MLEGVEILDVIAVLAGALVAVSLALAWMTWCAQSLARNLRDEETEHAYTRRRLEDVEALRRRDRKCREVHPYNRARCILESGHSGNHVTDGGPAWSAADTHDDGGPCTDCGTTGWGSDHDEDCRNHPGRHFDPEEVSELPAAIKRPAHAGYPDPIKARDIARSRPHLKAVDAGGCAPPIIVTVDSDRATDRAYADAGIMPMADYVAKYGREPRR